MELRCRYLTRINQLELCDNRCNKDFRSRRKGNRRFRLIRKRCLPEFCPLLFPSNVQFTKEKQKED